MVRWGIRAYDRAIGAGFVVAVGLVAVGVHLSHLLSEAGDAIMAVVYGAVGPLLVAVGLVVAGIEIVRREVDGDRALGLAGWCALGGVVVALMTALLVAHQRAEGVAMSSRVYVLANGFTVGAAVGLAMGAYDTRVEAERDRIRTLFTSLPNPAYRFEFREGEPIIREVNPAFEATFGYDAEEAVGQSANDLFVPENRRDGAAEIDRQVRAGSVVTREVRRRTVDGLRYFSLSSVPRADADPPSGFTVLVDVTERKQRTRRLQVLNRALRHDLRNDANVIIGTAIELAEEHPGSTPSIGRIRSRAEKMVEFSERVRRIERALDPDDRDRYQVAVASTVRECLERVERDHPGMSVRIDAVEGARATASPLIDTALENLFRNAVQHAEDGPPEIRVSVATTDGFVTVEITDDGPGFPESELEVFDRHRESQLLHSEGLGLWTARWIIEHSGGEVTVSNEDGSGARVRVALPRAEPESS